MSIEKRNLNVIFGKAGGNASKNSLVSKVSLPKAWLDKMDIDTENRGVTLTFNGKKIIIEKNLGEINDGDN